MKAEAVQTSPLPHHHHHYPSSPCPFTPLPSVSLIIALLILPVHMSDLCIVHLPSQPISLKQPVSWLPTSPSSFCSNCNNMSSPSPPPCLQRWSPRQLPPTLAGHKFRRQRLTANPIFGKSMMKDCSGFRAVGPKYSVETRRDAGCFWNENVYVDPGADKDRDVQWQVFLSQLSGGKRFCRVLDNVSFVTLRVKIKCLPSPCRQTLRKFENI